MENVCAVLLAAGDGKRMKSARPKVLCEVLFRPMILWVADAVQEAGVRDVCAVLGCGADEVRAVLPGHFAHVVQAQRKGTAHAVMMAADYIRSGGFEDVVVLCGDAPFVSAQDLRDAYEQHKTEGNDVTVFSAKVKNPDGYGRIVRDAGVVSAIVEHTDADPSTRSIDEINAGAYWFRAAFLLEALGQLAPANAQGEYYLTDTVALAGQTGRRVDAYIAHPDCVLGANDRAGLALLNEIARTNVIARLHSQGVDIPFPQQVVIGRSVSIGCDTTILPGCIIKGDTTIGEGCEIGPNSQLNNATLGDNCRVVASLVESSQVEAGATIGPFSNIRPGCVIGKGAKIGDFVEVKNSNIGAKSSVAHLSYIGDSDIGARCNLGCGIVTVNYDGVNKARVKLGDGSFVGCNVNLIAPVCLGERAYAAAGTTITQDVPAEALVIGRSRQVVKEGWNANGVKYKKGAKADDS